MANNHRDQKILELLRNSSTARVAELSKICDVSKATIRRDLERLQKDGKIERFHGGAILIEKADPEPPIIKRAAEQANQKRKIGQKASQLVKEGDTIFIGSGTTTEVLALHLKGRTNITVITNSLIVINHLVEENIPVIQTGGVLRPSERSFIGHLTEETLQELRPNKVFMGIRAISLEKGLTNDYLPEVTTDRVIIRSAPEVILLADHTKFGKVSTAFVAPLTAIDKIITDSNTPLSTIDMLQEQGIKVIVV